MEGRAEDRTLELSSGGVCVVCVCVLGGVLAQGRACQGLTGPHEELRSSFLSKEKSLEDLSQVAA